MSDVLNDRLMICSDCLYAIVYDDYTAISLLLGDSANLRINQIRRGIINTAGWIYPGDVEEDIPFSRLPCDCCGSFLHGARYHCVVLQPEERNEL